MSTKYKCTLQCKICGEELSTGWCKTRLEKWFKKRKLKKQHFHSQTEVAWYYTYGTDFPLRGLTNNSTCTYCKSPTYPRPPIPGSENIEKER